MSPLFFARREARFQADALGKKTDVSLHELQQEIHGRMAEDEVQERRRDACR